MSRCVSCWKRSSRHPIVRTGGAESAATVCLRADAKQRWLGDGDDLQQANGPVGAQPGVLAHPVLVHALVHACGAGQRRPGRLPVLAPSLLQRFLGDGQACWKRAGTSSPQIASAPADWVGQSSPSRPAARAQLQRALHRHGHHLPARRLRFVRRAVPGACCAGVLHGNGARACCKRGAGVLH